MRRWGLRVTLALATGIGIGIVDMVKEPVRAALQARLSGSSTRSEVRTAAEPERAVPTLNRPKSMPRTGVGSTCADR